MSKFYDSDFYGRGTECQFEPDIVAVLCADCGKSTGETGTCTDRGLCSDCRQSYVNADFSPDEIAEMVIGIVSGEYHYKATRRVLHLCRGDGQPLCRVFTNPQPVTTKESEVNCMRCLKLSKAVRGHARAGATK